MSERLDLLNGHPRGVRPITDADDLARVLTALGSVDDGADALPDTDPGPCMTRIPGPPFDPCPNQADPDNPDRLCAECAERRRT